MMGYTPLRERRRRAARRFRVRVCLLLMMMSAVAYAAWFAPWDRHPRPVKIEVTR